jgi:tetratricopeptide (TPR) repeat protein
MSVLLAKSRLLIGCLLLGCTLVACDQADDDGSQQSQDRPGAIAATARSADFKPETAGPNRGDVDAVAVRPRDPSTDADQPSVADRQRDRQRRLDQADRLAGDGQWDRAAAVLTQLLTIDPTDAESIFRLARVRASQGDLPTAVSLLESIPADHPEAGLAAIGQAADWCVELEQFERAEERYRAILARVPQATVAHRQLAWLLNRQGRRHEAAEHLKQLCKLGDIRGDELHGLMVVSHAMFTVPDSAPTNASARPYFPIGPLAYARFDFTHGRYRDAADRLESVIASENPPPAVQAFYGRLLVESQRDARFREWLATAEENVTHWAEYWAALGAYLLRQRDYEPAVRALAEAVDRDPTDPLSIRRMNQALLALGRTDQAKRWKKRYGLLNQTAHAANEIAEAPQPRSEAYTTVAGGLQQVGRTLEALTWELLGELHRNAPRDEVDRILHRRRELLQSGDGFPNRAERLCGLDPARFPLAELKRLPATRPATTPAPTLPAESPVQARFVDVAASSGLDHTYHVSDNDRRYAFAIYQTLGGGVAVLDYDRDGRSDLYFAQGGGAPGVDRPRRPNRLFRATGDGFRDVTSPSRTAERRYTVGVTAGDWNQDGFADLAVASIGRTTLWINGGDGTFSVRLLQEDKTLQRLPTSLAIADVSGDDLPDLVCLHDVDDPAMRDQPIVQPDGSFQDLASPLAFNAGTDQLFVNDGVGGFRSKPLGGDQAVASTGLGVVVADLNGRPGNEVFVGNDMRPNQWWVRDADSGKWQDLAAVAGCSHGHGGTTTASMGIAAADFDGNGSLDLHIANFYGEPVSLFLNERGNFADRCVSWRLSERSTPMLGFGCQPIDYDNDGDPDLAVTNGHVDKVPGQPFKQPPQLFANLGNHFTFTAVEDATGYWSTGHLGRAMARLDHDRDGKTDLVVTHVGSPSALLLNRSETDHHWVLIRLVGTSCERDAIGARATVRCGERTWTQWCVAGDGYLCRNEPLLHFGLGNADRVDELEIVWPNGSRQRHESLDVDRRWLIIQGQPHPFSPTHGNTQ